MSIYACTISTFFRPSIRADAAASLAKWSARVYLEDSEVSFDEEERGVLVDCENSISDRERFFERPPFVDGTGVEEEESPLYASADGARRSLPDPSANRQAMAQMTVKRKEERRRTEEGV